MKKIFIFLILFPLLSFGVDEWRVYPFYWDVNSGTIPNVENSYMSRCPTNNSPLVAFFSTTSASSDPWFGMALFSNSNSISYPSLVNAGNTLSSKSANKFIFNTVDSLYYSPMVFSDLQSFYVLVSSLYISGYRGPGVHFVGSDNNYIRFNFSPSRLLSDVLFGTNTLFRSHVVSFLSSISSSSTHLLANSSAGLDILSSLVRDYRNINYYSLSTNSTYNSLPAVLGDNPFFWYGDNSYASRVMDSLSDEFDLSLSSPAAVSRRSSFARAFDSLLTDSLSAYLLDQSSGIDKPFQDYVSDLPSTLQTLGSFSYATPLTNALHGLDGEWKAKATNELAAIRQDVTNRLDKKTWAGYVDKTTNDLSAISHNTSSSAAAASDISELLKGTQTGDGIRVKLPPGPYNVNVMNWPSDLKISLNKDSLDFMSETVGTIASKWDTWFGYWSSWNSDYYFPSLREQSGFYYVVTNQINRLLTVSNVLDDILVSITNLDLTVTNNISALLLDDYESFIDSSKFNDVVSSFPDDLSAALSSFGFSDSSDYSGRWWVFQSANMALQSQLALTNAVLSSTLLNALSAIDDSDDSGGSLLSRWLSLIDSIPDPEEIQQSLADATNIVSNVGFERADALYSTATQDLVSVVKGIYRDKSLPDNIHFVFIPAAHGREEKFVDIPVGDHSSLWSLFRSGMAFALSVVTLILFPKYVSWLVARYTRLVERIIKSLHAYTHQ